MIEYLIVLCTVALLGFGAWRGFGLAVADNADAAGDSVQTISSAATVGSEGARGRSAESLGTPTNTVGGALMGGTGGSGSDPTSASAGEASGALIVGGSGNEPEPSGGSTSVAIVEVGGRSAALSDSPSSSHPSGASNESGRSGGLVADILDATGAVQALAFRRGVQGGADEYVEDTADSLVQAARHPIETGKAVAAALKEIWDDPVTAGKAAWTAVRNGAEDVYDRCTDGTSFGCGHALGGAVLGVGTRSIPIGGPISTILRRGHHRDRYERAAEDRMNAQEADYNRQHYGDRVTGPARAQPGPWMNSRMQATVEAVRRGNAGPDANPEDVANYLQRQWTHSEEVGVLTQRMGGRSRRAPVAELQPGTPIIAHDLGEHVSRSSFIQNVREWRRTPLRDADGNAVPVPAWVEDMRIGDRNGSNPSWVDVGVLNPHVAAGLGRSGPPDVYARAVHNLAEQRRGDAIIDGRARRGPNAPGIENAQIEQIADHINSARRPPPGGTPVPFEQIQAKLVTEARNARLPNSVESAIHAGIRAQRHLEQGH